MMRIHMISYIVVATFWIAVQSAVVINPITGGQEFFLPSTTPIISPIATISPLTDAVVGGESDREFGGRLGLGERAGQHRVEFERFSGGGDGVYGNEEYARYVEEDDAQVFDEHLDETTSSFSSGIDESSTGYVAGDGLVEPGYIGGAFVVDDSVADIVDEEFSVEVDDSLIESPPILVTPTPGVVDIAGSTITNYPFIQNSLLPSVGMGYPLPQLCVPPYNMYQCLGASVYPGSSPIASTYPAFSGLSTAGAYSSSFTSSSFSSGANCGGGCGCCCCCCEQAECPPNVQIQPVPQPIPIGVPVPQPPLIIVKRKAAAIVQPTPPPIITTDVIVKETVMEPVTTVVDPLVVDPALSSRWVQPVGRCIPNGGQVGRINQMLAEALVNHELPSNYRIMQLSRSVGDQLKYNVGLRAADGGCRTYELLSPLSGQGATLGQMWPMGCPSLDALELPYCDVGIFGY